MSRRLRLGLLMDSYHLPAWEYAMLERIMRSDYGRIGLVVLDDSLRHEKGLVSRIVYKPNELLYLVYNELENARYRPSPNALETRDARALLANISSIRVKPTRRESFDWVKSKDIEKIGSYEIDILVKLGFRTLRGGILESSRFGVWSYHIGGDCVKRGEPVGFWEVFENHPVTVSFLQVQHEDFDDDLVVYRSYSSTDPASVNWNLNRCYWKMVSFLPRKLRELHRLGEKRFFAKVAEENKHIGFYSGKLHRIPTNAEMLRILPIYFLKCLRDRAYNAFSAEKWFLMFDLKDGISRSFCAFKWMMPPKDRFWADPHVVYRDGRYIIFIEEFLYAKGKGHISMIEVDKKGSYGKPTKILERPYHLSYPFVFEYKGDRYMIPESIGNQTIEVYECLEFPDKWRFRDNLMEDILAVDTTIHCHEGKWWLFANVKENHGASDRDELFLYSSNDPLGVDWEYHPQNPVVTDVRRSRPAGRIIVRNGRTYRPSQDCSRGYGYGIRINEIVTLNEKEYKEIEVAFIEPNWDESIRAVHTISYERGLTVIDGMTRRFRSLNLHPKR